MRWGRKKIGHSPGRDDTFFTEPASKRGRVDLRWSGRHLVGLSPPAWERPRPCAPGRPWLDLFVAQHLPQPRLQPLALQRLAVGGPGGQGSLAGRQEGIAPAAQRGRRDAQGARHRLQVLPTQQPQHRIPLAMPRHPTASARTCRIRRLCHHRHPHARKPSACGVSQSTVARRRVYYSAHAPLRPLSEAEQRGGHGTGICRGLLRCNETVYLCNQ